MTISHLLPVAAATLAAFFAGGLWYGPLFGKAWQAEQGLTDGEWARANKPRLFAISIACEAIVALVLSHVLRRIPHDGSGTMLITLATAFGLVLPPLVMNYSFALKSWTLIAIDAGHWLLVLLVIGVVFVALGV
jgi:hypothetical protein